MGKATLRNAQDAFVSEHRPKKNWNNASVMNIHPGRLGFLYFSRPFPLGAKIISATLKVWNKGDWTGGDNTIDLHSITSPWAVNKVNWDNKPSVSGKQSLTKNNPGHNTQWEFDITAKMQAVSDGGAWRGFRLNCPGLFAVGDKRKIHSTQTPKQWRRPRIEIEWSDAPWPPTDLTPDGGLIIAKAKPTLRFNFYDVSGNTNMGGYSVQIASDVSFNTIVLDTGTVNSSVPLCDTEDFAWAGWLPNQTLYWRVTVKDQAGLWSGWSPTASAKLIEKGTLTLSNPAPAEVSRNLVVNPSFEVDALNYSGSRCSIDRSTDWSSSGIASGLINITDNSSGAYLYPRDPVTGVRFPINPGSTARFQVKVRSSPDGDRGWRPSIAWYKSDNTGNGSLVGTWTAVDAGEERVFFLEAVAPADTTSFLPITYAGDTNGGAPPSLWEQGYIDEYIATVDEEIVAYFDGDKDPGMTAFTYGWAGTPHASQSIKYHSYVEEATPPIGWTLTGQVQSSYRVRLSSPEQDFRIRWDTGRVTSTDNSVAVPPGVIVDVFDNYRVTVDVWDDQNRIWTPGDNPALQASANFSYEFSDTVTPVTDLTVNPVGTGTAQNLEWTDPTQPDSYTILRDGKVLAAFVEAADFWQGGSSYLWPDWQVPGRTDHTWEVVRVVNGVSSAGNNQVTKSTRILAPVLMDSSGENEISFLNPNIDPGLTEDSAVIFPQGAAPALITQSLWGFVGTAEGVLSNEHGPASAEEMKNRFLHLRKQVHEKMYFMWSDEAIICHIYNCKYTPIPRADGSTDYHISFGFIQVDYL